MIPKDKGKFSQFVKFKFASLYEDEGWDRIEEFVQYQEDSWDDPLSHEYVSLASELTKPTMEDWLKRAHQQLSYLTTPTRRKSLKTHISSAIFVVFTTLGRKTYPSDPALAITTRSGTTTLDPHLPVSHTSPLPHEQASNDEIRSEEPRVNHGNILKSLATASVKLLLLVLVTTARRVSAVRVYPQLDNEDLQQIDADDLEEMDLKWQMVMLTMRARIFLNKTGRKVGSNGPETIGFIKQRWYCYNVIRGHFAKECKARGSAGSRTEEGPTNFALMAYTSSSSSSSDSKPQLNVRAYKACLESAEARLDIYKKNEAVFEEDIKILKLDVMLRDNALTELRKKFEKTEKERDDLKLTLEKFENSSKNLSKLLEIQVSDKFKNGVGFDSQVFNIQVNGKYKTGEGYHAVPPAYTGNFMPPKPDLVLANEDEYVFSESITSVPVVATSEVKTSESKPKSVSEPLIEDWISAVRMRMRLSLSESIKKIEFNKQAKYPRKNSQNPRGNKRNWNNLMTQKLGTAVSVNAARPINTACPRPTVNCARPSSNVINIAYSHVRRPFNKFTTNKNSNFNVKVNTIKGNVTTVRPKAVGNPQLELQEKGVIDSGCSRTGKLDFEDVYFVKELKFNLFSVSQMCDKKNNVLFTDTECVVLSPDFKLLDENQVLLRVPRKNNMYSVDLKNVIPSGGLICLFAKATLDESNLWHRRLGHINFKTMNKLVRGNLVRGLPLKIFENDHTCVACQKGKQHKASCRKPALSFMRPFGCPITILNTLDHIGSRPEWLFDIDTMTKSMMYKPVLAGNLMVVQIQTIREKEKKDAKDAGNKDSEMPNTEEPRLNQEKYEIPIPTTRIHKDHPVEQIIGDIHSAPQTRRMIKRVTDHVEPKKVIQALTYPRWIEAMQDELLQLKLQKIEEEVYVCQPLGFEDPKFPDRVYKRGTIDKTLFIKKVKCDILLVKVYVDDIIFGSTKKSLCTEFEKLMHKKFQMSSMSELTFFLGLQVSQKNDGIFISQDKYVDEILKKFGFSTMKTASTPIETSKPLMKDENAEDVDVHLYRSMIGSLMYLTSLRPDIMFAKKQSRRKQRQDTEKVLDLEALETAQDQEILSLKQRVKKLEKKKKLKPHGLIRLYKVGRSMRVESSEESLGNQKDASKQGRKIIDLDADAEEVMADKDVSTANPVTAANFEATTASAPTTTEEEAPASTPIVSSLQPSQVKDKGKTKMVEEEPIKKFSKKEKIRLDLELAFKLQAEEEEERLIKEKNEANIALIEEWDNVQAMIDADYQMAKQLQSEEQEQLTIKEKLKLFVQLLEARKKHFTALRAREKRNKPQTQAQQRKLYCNYLKNMEGYTLKQLKGFKFEVIKDMFNKAFKRVNTFVDYKTELMEENDDQEEAKMKQHMEIVVNEEEITVDAIPLATNPPIIVDLKIIKEGNMGYFQIIRADGSSKRVNAADIKLQLLTELQLMKD
ncbi:putative ribonuclease H-like domain-containing protein [Tanacetum coccineum]|uniref:Ribonuclease H-like domain-containing protein n=1 Tax=Tanacetum coccineum TaxID=301880 RepID=A0ABQ5FHG5_9ASTR